ncbi:hypothetical protein VST7929_03127 [Vibrio stylophorae]|uniref:TolC family protein n=1 Tax=Vibrio stylophorae TaxID=659351 RepID=A0ABM8ZXU5_9VIBR|nr:TolC family protein [Vibrio stylophorae]CAH0535584.1 hypothetical protein VST7929_03127 [Vibrio stylophorae]
MQRNVLHVLHVNGFKTGPRTGVCLSFQTLTQLCMGLGLFILWMAYSPAAMAQSQQISTTQTLSFASLLAKAQQQDPEQQRLSHLGQAQQADALSQTGWLNPKVKVGVGGLPTDSFALDQDMMTNLSVGIMQPFNRGDSAEIAKQRSDIAQLQTVQQLSLRRLMLQQQLGQLWVEWVYRSKLDQLLQRQKQLLSQRVRDAKRNYELGRAEAEALAASELALSQTKQLQLSNAQMKAQIWAQLSQFVPHLAAQDSADMTLSYPDWQQLTLRLVDLPESVDEQLATLMPLWQQHPMLGQSAEQIALAQNQVAMAQTALDPQFAVELMYANRQAKTMSGERAPDLMSVALTMDMPLFDQTRQDQGVVSAKAKLAAAKAQRDLIGRQVQAQLQSALSQRQYLQLRLKQFHQQLLRDSQAQRRAIARGYEADRNTLMELIQAELAFNQQQQAALRLTADLALQQNQLAYLLGFDLDRASLAPRHAQEARDEAHAE